MYPSSIWQYPSLTPTELIKPKPAFYKASIDVRKRLLRHTQPRHKASISFTVNIIFYCTINKKKGKERQPSKLLSKTSQAKMARYFALAENGFITWNCFSWWGEHTKESPNTWLGTRHVCGGARRILWLERVVSMLMVIFLLHLHFITITFPARTQCQKKTEIVFASF